MSDSPAINSSEADFLSPLHFAMVVKRLPNVPFMVTRVVIPGVSLSPVEVGTPFVDIPMPADHISFDELEIAFKVDGHATNWKGVFDWVIGTSFPNNFGERIAIEPSGKISDLYSDVSILLFDYHKNPVIRWDFIDTLPVSMSRLVLDVSEDDVKYVEATVQLKFRDFTMVQLYPGT